MNSLEPSVSFKSVNWSEEQKNGKQEYFRGKPFFSLKHRSTFVVGFSLSLLLLEWSQTPELTVTLNQTKVTNIYFIEKFLRG